MLLRNIRGYLIPRALACTIVYERISSEFERISTKAEFEPHELLRINTIRFNTKD